LSLQQAVEAVAVMEVMVAHQEALQERVAAMGVQVGGMFLAALEVRGLHLR
jgi:poly(3-hydroxyalkanoate) synthetase